MRSFVTFILCLFLSYSYGQIDQIRKDLKASKSATSKEGATLNNNMNGNNSSSSSIDIDTKASDYRFITLDNDTTFVDTTLNITKQYRLNYLRKDYFELLPFSNTGQVFNVLGYDYSEDTHVFSRFGARAKQIDYDEVNDVKYYEG